MIFRRSGLMHFAADAACRRRLAVASLAAMAAALGACSGTQPSAVDTSGAPVTSTANAVASRPPRSPIAPPVSAGTSSPVSSSPSGRLHVVVTRTPWHLPYPVSRAVATASDGAILLAGGLNPDDASRTAAVWIRPSDGRVLRSGSLPMPTHDAAGWALHGGLVVAGGGTSSSVATVEQVLPSGAGRVMGSLPRPRSDAVGARVGPVAYVVGGYNGAVLDPVVLASTDGGATFHDAARLPVPVRYPAVTTTGTTLWVVGGQTAHGLTDVVQRVDTVSGKTRIVGRLPKPLEAATTQGLGGRLIVFGGATPKGTTSAILTCSTSAVRCKVTGRLPYAVQNAAVATVGWHTYLLGGERNGVPLDRVTAIHYVRTASA